MLKVVEQQLLVMIQGLEFPALLRVVDVCHECTEICGRLLQQHGGRLSGKVGVDIVGHQIFHEILNGNAIKGRQIVQGIDGFTVCKKLREKSSTLGIIMLTAKAQEMDKVNGLMLGADDYLTKPFSPSELTARVDAIYRRVCMSFIKDEKSSILKSGPFILDIKSRTVTKNGLLIDLTQVEYQIIEYFMNNKNTALDRSSILTHIWGENYYGDDKIVDVNIRRIRMKIEDEPSSPKYILTIWGYGYKWDEK